MNSNVSISSPPPAARDSAAPAVVPSGTGMLEVEQILPVPPDVLWPFFADAGNLEQLTPPWLRFRVLTPPPIAMAVGTLIDYQLRWRGLPIRWRTRIARWDPPHVFVDEQLKGPYRLWRHTHTFERQGDRTVMRDRVEYRAPLGWIAHPLIVRRDVARIFDYRRSVLERIEWARATS